MKELVETQQTIVNQVYSELQKEASLHMYDSQRSQKCQTYQNGKSTLYYLIKPIACQISLVTVAGKVIKKLIE